MRSDDDTWDITTSVGATALFVAAARALEAQRADPVAVDPYAEVFCRAVGGSWADVLDGKAPDNRLKSEFGEVFQSFAGARTRFFDSYLRDASADGVRQIVILAAGLDSRAYRLRWPADTTVFELDQPKVLEFKREVLTGHGDAPTTDRREVAVDLREDWPKALRDSGFDAAEPSAWLAEGLLMYLPASAQEQLYGGIDSLAVAGSHVALEEMQPMPADAFEAKRAEERAQGQAPGTFFRLIYNEQHREAVAWFGDHGWEAAAISAADYVCQVGRPVPPPDTDGGQMLYSGSLVTARKQP
ncbi:MAG: SAM-dependent methyltransferase [Mycobacteriaceae bacterium]|nr:SAM-dependent methyltransferase [Mycobacteriaceae bacterium]